MKVVIKREGDGFCLDPVDLPGSPYVGRGETLVAAMGNFMSLYAKELGLKIEVEPEAVQHIDKSVVEYFNGL